MNTQNKKSFITYIGIVAAILVIFNVVSRNWFFRLDLTENKMYSLSESSKSVVSKIDDRLTMKVYFSDNLPGEYGNNKLSGIDISDLEIEGGTNSIWISGNNIGGNIRDTALAILALNHAGEGTKLIENWLINQSKIPTATHA